MLLKITNRIYKIIRIYRLLIVTKIINKESKNILDIGCQDFSSYNKLKGSFDITLADAYPKNEKIKKEHIEFLSFGDKIFDTVLCLEVLEHTHDPVRAIKELQRVTKKDLIISIPNEPFFSFFRLLFWEKEHLWAITPKVLKYYLGTPEFEKTFFLKRYYIAKWSF
ncbi:MAG TPA: methyltransferase domain-containing protein [Thermodesulfobacteriota bacterium]|nr:methyltransferase domain-containing protein [Thermodesulfobacteriota bacterium]